MGTIDRKELREEIEASGAENIANDTGGEARINRWIQQAIREICDYKPWPFLLATKEGKAPLEIADLGHVQAVSDLSNDNTLEPITLNQALLGDPDLDSTGNPEYWYTEDGETIKIFPASTTTTIKVYYRKTPAELEDEGEPIIPADYHSLIVDLVMVKVYKKGDNFEAAAEVLKDYERKLEGMVHALMKRNYDKERRMTRTGSRGDYL